MPYRRLPNTNQARLRSLQQAVEMGNTAEVYNLAFSYELWENAKAMLVKYQKALSESRQSCENQFSKSRKLQEDERKARLYVSHFIQTLNMCVLRGEIKTEHKLLYELDPEDFSVPDLNSDENLILWGKRVIEGERKRTMQGGIPIYNPTIANVRVFYDTFLDGYNRQKVLQNNTARCIDNVSVLNKEVDQLILGIWDEVEKKYSELPLKEKINSCREYGLVYYYRKGEKRE